MIENLSQISNSQTIENNSIFNKEVQKERLKSIMKVNRQDSIHNMNNTSLII